MRGLTEVLLTFILFTGSVYSTWTENQVSDKESLYLEDVAAWTRALYKTSTLSMSSFFSMPSGSPHNVAPVPPSKRPAIIISMEPSHEHNPPSLAPSLNAIPTDPLSNPPSTAVPTLSSPTATPHHPPITSVPFQKTSPPSSAPSEKGFPAFSPAPTEKPLPLSTPAPSEKIIPSSTPAPSEITTPPSSSAPSKNALPPPTSNPTILPITLAPTMPPTTSPPTILQPSPAPTILPTTSAPSEKTLPPNTIAPFGKSPTSPVSMPTIIKVPNSGPSSVPVTNSPLTDAPFVVANTSSPALEPSESPSLSSAVADDDASNDSPALVLLPSASPTIRRRYI